MLTFLVLFALPLVLVYLAGPWAVKCCRARGLMAPHTEERHIHSAPTPHGGGFLLPMVVVPVGLIVVWGLHLPFAGFLTTLLLCSIPVAYIGWRDDHAHVEPRIRLAIHLGAVGLGLMFLPALFDFMPLWAEKALLLFAWGWFVNLYNFMDGADGLAISEAIFISLALAMIVPVFAPLALLIAGAGTGFLRVNLPKAKVFMGDVSSTWLGYILGGLLLVACADDTWVVIWPLATITLVFCADATSTLIRRILTGHKPWEPHNTFWFHRFLSLGFSHGHLLIAVLALNLLLLLCAFIGLHSGMPSLSFILGFTITALAAASIRHADVVAKWVKMQ